ncbi:molybdopterin-guanine dinucleotide biosynthesis protein A [Primorskyibacter flagellatus]|uniref:Molybdopterin-guanine dinucleotide biosynthesis protein A n=1 Tax=Primorskyibacter flagellatus TaxID=1387277 RepID=A0A917EE67_9RHOB|nr:nucleotidyltransferase family protein [Primorskyibacter flagellatus]GGE23175.1 molybdopterin-guanine dinucleotide biosynthesis protein A [Primorskyibacter flagellatus]
MSLAILLLAAGSSSRMRGGDKLMEEVEGAPLLATMARRALAATDVVLVTLPRADHPRSRAIRDLDVTRVLVPDAEEGMGASIRAAIPALTDRETALMILPADMPDITTGDLQTLASAWQSAPDAIHRATNADGTPGHPVIFPARLFPDLKALTGDTGARALLPSEHVKLTALPGTHATTDLDTPEDWAAWRAR